MKARLIFQKLCLKGKDWDDPLEEEDLKVWNKWVQEYKEAKKIEFKRLVLPRETSNDLKMTMHTFCDASEKGYCTTVYLVVDSEKEVTSNLLTAKCRLAPLKKLTIPRLELASAKTGATITKVVQNALQTWDLGETHIWMDSLTALYWLQNKGVWKLFINNRVKETLRLVPMANWHHVPTDLNPSDIGTRGMAADKLKNSKLWWEGPEFIKDQREKWPIQPEHYAPCEEAKCEERNPVVTVSSEEDISLKSIMEPEKFSTMERLLNVTARGIRFAWNTTHPKENLTSKELTVEELVHVRDLWIMEAQRGITQKDNFDDLAKNLGVIKGEDTLMRCKG